MKAAAGCREVGLEADTVPAWSAEAGGEQAMPCVTLNVPVRVAGVGAR